MPKIKKICSEIFYINRITIVFKINFTFENGKKFENDSGYELLLKIF